MGQIDPSFFVNPGDPISARPWNAAGRAIRALRLIAGWGVRLRETANGTIINFDRGQSFNHPFRVSMQGDTAAVIQPGRINKVSATIDGVLLEGDDKNQPPILEFKDGLALDSDGKGWIAAEVTCSEKDWSIVTVEIVQVSDLDSDDGNAPEDGTASLSSSGGVPNLPGRRARAALALLRQGKGGNVRFWQCTHFDLQHRRVASAVVKDPLADDGRHFFYV